MIGIAAENLLPAKRLSLGSSQPREDSIARQEEVPAERLWQECRPQSPRFYHRNCEESKISVGIELQPWRQERGENLAWKCLRNDEDLIEMCCDWESVSLQEVHQINTLKAT